MLFPIHQGPTCSVMGTELSMGIEVKGIREKNKERLHSTLVAKHSQVSVT